MLISNEQNIKRIEEDNVLSIGGDGGDDGGVDDGGCY
jgi:hypothetical protein